MDKPFSAYQGNDPYVFVCYDHDDAESVYREIAWLNNHGINLWYDEGISPGLEWTDALAGAIQGCSKVLYFVTRNSVTSEHCRKELNFAQEEAHDVVAVHLEPTEVPPGLRLSLNNRQAILRHELSDEHYHEELMQAAQAAAGAPRVPVSQPSTPAPRRGFRLAIAGFASSRLARLRLKTI